MILNRASFNFTIKEHAHIISFIITVSGTQLVRLKLNFSAPFLWVFVFQLHGANPEWYLSADLWRLHIPYLNNSSFSSTSGNPPGDRVQGWPHSSVSKCLHSSAVEKSEALHHSFPRKVKELLSFNFWRDGFVRIFWTWFHDLTRSLSLLCKLIV